MKKSAWLMGAGAAAAGVSALTAYFFNYAIVRKPNQGMGPDMDTGTEWEPFYGLIDERRAWLTSRKSERISIRSYDGLELQGTYFPNENLAGQRLVICFHGYMSQGMNDFPALAPFYYRMGYDMLIVDNRAHGASEGKYVGFGCLDRFDCEKWVGYAAQRFGETCSIVLHGISMGASTVLMASGLPLPPHVRAIIADCGFTSPWDVFASVLKRNYHLPPFPLLHTTSALCHHKAGYGFRDYSTLQAVNGTDIPILFIHGEDDDFVPTHMSREAYVACTSKKDLLIVPGAGHAASYYHAMEQCESTMAHFLEAVSASIPAVSAD